MRSLLVNLFEPQIQFTLHGFRTVASDQIGAQAGGSAKPRRGDGYIRLGVTDRVDHVARDDHDGSSL
ncbi:hypothetical protein [Streptomyces sp. YIM 132580]|uniref:hypothetical protein n=1 Tax=Streptomyces sp. YIM 132580 TaxID=2691958 RepID=UPI001367EEC0|nr:hypothetical protein [Streptomyces sp. YIM 132580]